MRLYSNRGCTKIDESPDYAITNTVVEYAIFRGGLIQHDTDPAFIKPGFECVLYGRISRII